MVTKDCADECPSRPQEKTLILFVIRDHVGSTPMSNLTATLTQDMEKIWASLSKVRLHENPDSSADRRAAATSR